MVAHSTWEPSWEDELDGRVMARIIDVDVAPGEEHNGYWPYLTAVLLDHLKGSADSVLGEITCGRGEQWRAILAGLTGAGSVPEHALASVSG